MKKHGQEYEKVEPETENSGITNTSNIFGMDHESNLIQKLKGHRLFRSRIQGLLTKRIICTWRRWALFLLIVSVD